MAEAVFTQKQLMDLIAEVNRQNADNLAAMSRDADVRMLEAIKELKKPSEYEQGKIDKERELERRKLVAKVKEAVVYGRTEKENQFRCSHIKHAEGVFTKEHAFRAQVNSDNFFRPQCIRCFKSFPRIKCTDEQIKSGTGLQRVSSLNAEILLQWHIKTDPGCKDCSKGGCAVGDLRQMKQGYLDPMPTVLPDGKILASQLA